LGREDGWGGNDGERSSNETEGGKRGVRHSLAVCSRGGRISNASEKKENSCSGGRQRNRLYATQPGRGLSRKRNRGAGQVLHSSWDGGSSEPDKNKYGFCHVKKVGRRDVPKRVKLGVESQTMGTRETRSDHQKN